MSEDLRTDVDGTTTVTTTVTYWGCQFVRGDGSVYLTRWNPSYGTGDKVPYTENEARADVARASQSDGALRRRLVTRTETTIEITPPWTSVD